MKIKKIDKMLISLIALLFLNMPANANPLKCNSKQPLLCRKAIIELLQKAGINKYFIEDGDIILTMNQDSSQYAAIKDTLIGIYVHEYNGVNVVTRELTVADVVGFESKDSATNGHHPRYGLNVLTTLATTGSFSHPVPQLVNAKLPGQTKSGPVKVTLVVARGTIAERTVEFILRKNDMSTALAGMQGLGILDSNFNLVISKLNSANKYTLTAEALAKLAGVSVSSLHSGDKTTFEYSFSAASEDDVKHDSLDVSSTRLGTAQLILTTPKPPALVTVPTVTPTEASKAGATPTEQALLDASNFIGVYTGSKNSVDQKYQKLAEIQSLLAKASLPNQASVNQKIDNVKKIVQLAGGFSNLEKWIRLDSQSGPGVTPRQKALLQVFRLNFKTISSELRTGVLGSNSAGQGLGDELFTNNEQSAFKHRVAVGENRHRQEIYNRQLNAFKAFEKKQKQVSASSAASGIKFYAIDGTSSYSSANDFLKAHGQVDSSTGHVKAFNELTKASANSNHGGSLGYQHFGGSPEFLTSHGNPTPKPYWVHEYICKDSTCSSYTAVNKKTIQSSDQGKLFRLDQYSGPTRQRLENLIMNGNLEGADPNGRLVQQIGGRMFIFEPLNKDPATTWQPALLHSYNQASTGAGPKTSIPADMSGFSVGYQVCGPNGCTGLDKKSGLLSAGGAVTDLGIVGEQASLLQSLQSLGAIAANGQIKGIGTDKDGKIIVFTQIPGNSDLVKLIFSKATDAQVAAAGFHPLSKPVALTSQSPTSKTPVNPQIYTITVSDKDGHNTATKYPGVVTQEKLKTLISTGTVINKNGKYEIQGTHNPDGTITSAVLLQGTEYKFTFHPGIFVGSLSTPNPITQALNKQQVSKFFNSKSAQAAGVSALKPIPNTGIQAQKNINHINKQRRKIANQMIDNNKTQIQPNQKQKGTRSTITFSHKVAPDTHIDGLNINQHFVTPASGNQIELGEAPTFVDSNNKKWLCMVSGLGYRIATNVEGEKTVHGHAETLNFNDPLVTDIPGSKHSTSSNCLISINHD